MTREKSKILKPIGKHDALENGSKLDIYQATRGDYIGEVFLLNFLLDHLQLYLQVTSKATTSSQQ